MVKVLRKYGAYLIIAALLAGIVRTEPCIKVLGANSIDDGTILTVEQAGSIAPHSGDYGWDSRGAQFLYSSKNGALNGSLGTIMFRDSNGDYPCFIWDSWGYCFPEWWSLMLAEEVRNQNGSVPPEVMRSSFSEGVVFLCTWIIAIGLKSSSAGGNLYKTLRTDNTLRVAYGKTDLCSDEVLFTGDEMMNSLSYILPGESWESGTLSTFRDRNPYKYTVRVQSYGINLYATNCVECAKKAENHEGVDCPHVKKGTFFVEQIPIQIHGTEYSGDEAFVWEGQEAEFKLPEYEGFERSPEDDDMSGMTGYMDDSIICPFGDCTAYFAYTSPEPEKQNLTLNYVTLKSSGTAMKESIYVSSVPDGITVGEVFSISLSDTLSVGGKKYKLMENQSTGLSYSSNPKFSNAVKGTYAYPIVSSGSSGGSVTYSTGTSYDKKKDAVLYVPVETVTPTETPKPSASPKPSATPKPSTTPKPTKTPSSPGTARPTPTPRPTPIPVITPEPAKVEELSFGDKEPNTSLRISSDTFNVSRAIPSTETVYVRGETDSHLYSLSVSRVSGRWPIRVKVIYPYILHWQDESGEHSEEEDVTAETYIFREYSYLHINSFALYALYSITVSNSVLNPSTVRFGGAAPPGVGTPVSYGTLSPAIGRNIDYPLNHSSTVIAEETVLEGGSKMPEIPAASEALTQELAEAANGPMRIRNDELSVDGTGVLGTKDWHAYSGSENVNARYLSPDRVYIDSGSLYGRDYITIPAGTRNRVYDTNAAVVSYTPKIRYGGASISFNPVVSVNSVSVHTPVVCNLQVSECDTSHPNSSYCQNDDALTNDMMLIVGTCSGYGSEGHEHDSSDFILEVSNTGEHSVYAGVLGSNYDYGRNVSGLEGGTYVAQTRVRLGFDAWLDTGFDYSCGNDVSLKAGEWYTLSGRNRIYITEEVPEGDYVITAAVRAVNATGENDYATTATKNGYPYIRANVSVSDYWAFDSVKVRVLGKMYGMTMYNVEKSPEWSDVFTDGSLNKYLQRTDLADGTLLSVLPEGRSADIGKYRFYYTSGDRNELGLSTGRHIRFGLPLLAGSSPDSTGQNKGLLKSGYRWQYTLFTTGSVMAEKGACIKIKPEFYWISDSGEECIPATLYYKSNTGKSKVELKCTEGSSYSEICASEPAFNGSSDKGKQQWFFEYLLPEKVYVITEGTQFSLRGRMYEDFDSYARAKGTIDFDEDCWKRDGYLIVRFVITAYDSKGEVHLNYGTGDENCCMWLVEGQLLKREDYYGREFSYPVGTVAVLKVGSGIADDYIVDHRN